MMKAIKTIEHLIEQGQIIQALNNLKAFVTEFEQYALIVRSLISQYNGISREASLGTLSYDKLQRQKNKLTSQLLALCEEIKNDRQVHDFIKEKNARYFIGLDFGDSETTLTVAEIIEKETGHLDLKVASFSQLTALLELEKQYEIGEKVFITCKDPNDIKLNFKSAPVKKTGMQAKDEKERRAYLQQKQYWDNTKNHIEIYLSAFLFEAREAGILTPELDDATLHFGHPSSWDPETVTIFTQFLQGFLGDYFKHIRVVPESRSALITAKDSKTLPLDDFKKNVLVIDIGSSTIDFTVISNGEIKEVAKGKNFGAKYIEISIREWIINQLDEQTKDDLFDKNTKTGRKNIQFLTFLAKKHKEAIFSNEDLPSFEFKDDTLNKVYKIAGNYLLQLTEDGIRSLIINKDYGADYSDITWDRGFELLLSEVKDYINTDLSAIILTGGGALMPFTQQICSNVFGINMEKIHKGENPLISVSYGLTRYGIWKYKLRRFQEDVNKLCEENLKKHLRENLLPFYNSIMNEVFPLGYDYFVKPRIIKYINGDIDIKELGESITKYAGREVALWLNTNPEGQALRKKLTKSLNEKIKEWVNSTLHPVCNRYDVPAATFNLDIMIPSNLFEHKFIEFFSKIFTSAFKGVLGQIPVSWRKKMFSFLVEGKTSEIIERSYKQGMSFSVNAGQKMDQFVEGFYKNEQRSESLFRQQPFFNSVLEAIYQEVYREINKAVIEEYEIFIK